MTTVIERRKGASSYREGQLAETHASSYIVKVGKDNFKYTAVPDSLIIGYF
jgi:uncharacterized protein Veg